MKGLFDKERVSVLGKQVYLSKSDIEALELLENIFCACVGNGEEYTDEERMIAQKLFDKTLGIGASTVGYGTIG